MKPHPAYKFGMTLALLGLALAVVPSRAKADEWNKKTYLTVDQPIQVRDTLLQPGTYVFMLANSESDRHIVRIFDRDQKHLIDTVMAIPNYRLQPTGNSRFSFYETPAGTARALRAWFYPGDNFGQEFPRPKHFHEIAAVTTVRTAPPPPPPPAVAEAPAPPPAPVETQTQVETQVEIAQNNAPIPPPAAEQPPPPPPPVVTPEPTVLPKTATPFALIGLGGLFSLVLFGLLRVQRSS